jgi:hypothetical protein
MMQVQIHQMMNDVLLHNKAAQHTRKEIAKQCWIVLTHPPYNLEVGPSDFHLFGPTKYAIHGRKFREVEVIKRAKIWLQ